MKQTITIEVPEGKTYKQTTDKDGNIIIQYFDKEPVRSRSWEEFCNNHHGMGGYYISAYSNDVEFGRTNKNITSKHLLATKEDAEGILALIQLTRLHDEWVGDWKPDYSNYLVKWCIGVCENKIVVTHTYYTQSLLVFPTREMTDEFLKCFKDLLEKAKKFI